MAALVLTLAACGDDGPTEKGFRAAATRVCHEGNARLLRLPLPRTEEEIRAFDERIERSERRLLGDLRAVEAPKRLEARYERAVAAGDRADAYDQLMKLGLPDCAAFGLTGIPGGGDFNAQLSAQCEDATIQIERAVDEQVGKARARGAADALRSLHRQIEYDRPPASARVLFATAVTDVKAAARTFDEVASGTFSAADNRRSRLLFGRIAATWVLLNAGECEEVWSSLNEEAGA